MGDTVSANQSIFAQLSAPRTTRLVSTPNGTLSLYSNMAIGTVSGEQRTIEAAMAEYVGQGDHWAIVNLFDGDGYVGTVAVLGANSLDQAGEWALRQYGDVNGAIRYTLATAHYGTLKRYLDRTPYKAEITQKSLDVVASKITNTPIVWSDSKLMSHGGSSLNLLLDLVKTDFDSDMVRPMTTTDLLIGSDIAEYDALIVQYGKLDMMMNRLTAAMGKAAIGGLTVTDVQQTKPFKKDNATNVASVFTLSDGQTLSIIFHNPDATPKKLSTTDDVVSWKWLLNKRDVSAAVQPEQGKDVQLPALAVRMLKVANANSKRFKAAAAKRNENEIKLTELQARMTDKGNLSNALDATIADLQSQIDARAQGVASEPEQDVTQQEADDWNVGDEIPFEGEYLDSPSNGVIKYRISKPRRGAKGILVQSATKLKEGAWKPRIDRLCEAKGISGRWSHVQAGYVVASEKKVEKLIDLLNTGWDASPMTGELIAPTSTDAQPEAPETLEPQPTNTQQEKILTKGEIKTLEEGGAIKEWREKSGKYRYYFEVNGSDARAAGIHMGFKTYVDESGRFHLDNTKALTAYRDLRREDVIAMSADEFKAYATNFIFGVLSENAAYNLKPPVRELSGNMINLIATGEMYLSTDGTQVKTADSTISAGDYTITGGSIDVAKRQVILQSVRRKDGTEMKAGDADTALAKTAFLDWTKSLIDFVPPVAPVKPVDDTEPQPTEPVAAPAQTASDTQPTEDADLVYWKDSKGFVEFLPVTKSGESAWNQIASQWKDAWQKAFPDMDVRADAIAPEKDLAKVLKSLRGAGYTVRARREGETFMSDEISNMSDDELLSELDLPQPTENPDMTYLQSIIDGGVDLSTLAQIKAAQTELKRIDAGLEANPDDVMDDLVGRAFELVKNAAKKAMQAAA